MLGNGVCDMYCNNIHCSFDDGDCLQEECESGCEISKINDGSCQSECNVENCNFDGDDCIEESTCDTVCQDVQGNRVCNDECNTSGCEWDGGDCLCSSECTPDLLGIEDPVCEGSPCNVESCSWHAGKCGVCSSGCFQDMLDNDTCEEICRVQACGYDNGKCSTCSSGCSTAIQGNCEPECMTALCGWDTYMDKPSCDQTVVQSFYKAVQSVKEDWSLIDVQDGCSKTGCNVELYIELLKAKSKEVCSAECNNEECGYSLGTCYYSASNTRCMTYFGDSNGQCLSCKSPYKLLYKYCLTVCPQGYIDSKDICIHKEETSLSSPLNYYISAVTTDLILELIKANERYQTINLSPGDHLVQRLTYHIQSLDLTYLDPYAPLYKPGYDIQLITIQPWMCSSQLTNPSSCYSYEISPDNRPTMKWTSWISLDVRHGTQLVISNINLYGRYKLITTIFSHYEDYCPYTTKTANNDNIVKDQRNVEYSAETIPSSSYCAEYHELSLFEVDSTTLKLENVRISYFRMELDAIIKASGKATIELVNVDFEFIRVSPQTASAVVVFEACPEINLPYDCGVLSYIGGTVYGLNDGFEVESDVKLQGFLYASNAKLIKMEGIEFSYGLVYSSYEDSGLLNLYSFRQIILEDIVIEYTVMKRGLLNIFGKVEISEDIDSEGKLQDHFLTHIYMKNIKVINSYAYYGLVMNIIYLNDPQNMSLSSIEIDRSICNSVFYIMSSSLSSESALGGTRAIYINESKIYAPVKSKELIIHSLTITNSNLGQKGVFHSEFYSNIFLDSLFIDNSNSQATTFKTSIKYYFLYNEDLYMQLTNLSDPSFSYLSYIDSIYNFTLSNSRIENYSSSSSHASSFTIGLSTSGWNNYTYIQNSTFSNITSYEEDGSAVLKIYSNNEIEISSSVFQNNLNKILSSYGAVYIKGSDSTKVYLEDVEFLHNKGGAAGGVCIDGAKEVYINKALFHQNYAIGKNGGGIYVLPRNSVNMKFSMSYSQFVNNYARGFGGGISFDNPDYSLGEFKVEIQNCEFEGSYAEIGGSSLSMMEYTLFAPDSYISNSTFTKTLEVNLGTVYLAYLGGTVLFQYCNFTEITSAHIGIFYIKTQKDVPLDSSSRSYVAIKDSVMSYNSGDFLIYLDDSNIYSSLYTENNYIYNNTGIAFRLEYAYLSDLNSVIQNNTALKGSPMFLNFESKAEMTETYFVNNYGMGRGGAVVLSNKSGFVCKNCYFYQNWSEDSGGAIFLDQNSYIQLEGGGIMNNVAMLSGSAIVMINAKGEASRLKDVVLIGNEAKSIGTITLYDSKLMMIGCIFGENISELSPGIILNSSELEVKDSIFRNQHSSLPPFISSSQESTILLTNCSFSNGQSEGYGGAIGISGSNITIEDSSFTDLQAYAGGCISSIQESQIIIHRSSFIDTMAIYTAGCIYSSLSTLEIYDSKISDVFKQAIHGDNLKELGIYNSLFTNITVIFEGNSGPVGCASCDDVIIANSTFMYNEAELGGALHLRLSSSLKNSFKIYNCTFDSNSALHGGAIYITQTSVDITNSYFINNEASNLLLDSYGGAIYLEQTGENLIYIANSTFESNIADTEGGAIKWNQKMPEQFGNVFISNSAVYGDDLAGYPVQVRYASSERRELFSLDNVPSGQVLDLKMKFEVLDELDQIIKSDNSSVCGMELENASGLEYITGLVRITAVEGVCSYSDLILFGVPTSEHNIKVINSAIVDENAVLKIFVSLRDCIIGENKISNGCIPCAKSTYNLEAGAECLDCPDNAECRGLDKLIPDEGYWRSSYSSDEIYECLLQDACLGGDESNLLGICEDGYEGNLCQSCKDGYSRVSTNQCAECPDDTTNGLILLGIFTLMILVIGITARSSISSAYVEKSMFSVYFKILLNFFQLMSIMSSFKFNWPGLMLELFNVTSQVDSSTSQIFSIDCMIEDQEPFYIKLIILAILPTVLAIVLLIVWGAIYCVFYFKTEKIEHCMSKVIGSITVVFFLIHPTIITFMFASFNCMEIESGEYWLLADLEIKCWKGDHLTYALACALPSLIVWGILTPALCLHFLTRKRKDLLDIRQKLRFGFLYHGFKETRFYWEFVILYRKVILIALSVFLTNYSINAQALTVLLTVLVYLYLQYIYRPYTLAELNDLEKWAILISAATIYAGLYYLTVEVSKF